MRNFLVVISISIFALTAQKRLPFYTVASSSLFQPSTITGYLGGFKIPHGTCGLDGCSSVYGVTSLAFNPAGNSSNGSLVVTGSPRTVPGGGTIAEISVETDLQGGASISSSNVTYASMPTAKLLKDWPSGITQLNGLSVSNASNTWFGGLLLDPQDSSKYIVSGFVFGTGGVSDNHVSHSRINTSLDTSTFTSWYPISTDGSTGHNPCSNISNCDSNRLAGPMTAIPSRWQSALGGDMLTGLCCITTNPIPGDGMTFVSVNSADIGVNIPAAGHTLVYYNEFTHPTLGSGDGSTPGNPWIWAAGDRWASMLWPSDYDTAIVFTSQGTGGHNCYGPTVGALNGNGYTNEPVESTFTGNDASTNATGLIITLPNQNVSGQDTRGHGIWLHGQTTPTAVFPTPWYSYWGYEGSDHIVATANSGAANASVTVTHAFTPNLTGITYSMGEMSCYDPETNKSDSSTVGGGHGPTAYPYNWRMWLYDANDLAAVKAGSKNEWEPVPYSYTNLSMPIAFPSGGVDYAVHNMGGAVVNTNNHRIYISQNYVTDTHESVITVWGYATPEPAPLTKALFLVFDYSMFGLVLLAGKRLF